MKFYKLADIPDLDKYEIKGLGAKMRLLITLWYWLMPAVVTYFVSREIEKSRQKDNFDQFIMDRLNEYRVNPNTGRHDLIKASLRAQEVQEEFKNNHLKSTPQ